MLQPLLLLVFASWIKPAAIVLVALILSSGTMAEAVTQGPVTTGASLSKALAGIDSSLVSTRASSDTAYQLQKYVVNEWAARYCTAVAVGR